jgi:hypothetical protein
MPPHWSQCAAVPPVGVLLGVLTTVVDDVDEELTVVVDPVVVVVLSPPGIPNHFMSSAPWIGTVEKDKLDWRGLTIEITCVSDAGG